MLDLWWWTRLRARTSSSPHPWWRAGAHPSHHSRRRRRAGAAPRSRIVSVNGLNLSLSQHHGSRFGSPTIFSQKGWNAPIGLSLPHANVNPVEITPALERWLERWWTSLTRRTSSALRRAAWASKVAIIASTRGRGIVVLILELVGSGRAARHDCACWTWMRWTKKDCRPRTSTS